MIGTVIDAARADTYSAQWLRDRLVRGVADADNLQHVNIQVHSDCVVFTLFPATADRFDAAVRAEQLSRHTTASVSGSDEWSVWMTAAGP